MSNVWIKVLTYHRKCLHHLLLCSACFNVQRMITIVWFDIASIFLVSQYKSDIGRIYIKGYLYPISYPKIAKKDIPLSFFWVGYVEGYNILILGLYKFWYPILSYILFRKNWQFWGTFALQNAFFLLNTEINCEYPLLNYVNKLTIF
jgi:hypothetical protein